jgi:hypothetical protein
MPALPCKPLICVFLLILQRSSSATHQHPSRPSHVSRTMNTNITHISCGASLANTSLHITARTQSPQNPAPPNARVHSASAHLRAGQAKAGACSALKLSQKSHSACTRRHETQVNNNRIECCVQHSEERGSASGKRKQKLTRFSPL